MPRLPLVLLVLAAGLAGCGAPEQASLSDEERLALAPDPVLGQRLAQTCRTCHEVAEGSGHRVGPNLWGVVGAPAGRHAGFRYSRALEGMELVWDEATLDAYLKAPQAVVPGGRMAYPGNPSEADRRDVIAYLKTLDGTAE